MSETPTSRLDSLSRRSSGPSAPGSKPGLKFKPKVVARRSKEERAADAPTHVPAENNRPVPRVPRGRGGIRGGRGGRAMAGTHIVQAGPLASGNAIGDGGRLSGRSRTASPTPDYLSHLFKKEVGSRDTSVGLGSDDEDDLRKININEEYKFPVEETELFPVRAPRAKLGGQVKKEAISLSSTTSTRENSPEVMEVKTELEDQTLSSVLKERDEQLQKKLNELQIKNEALTLGTEEALESTQRLNDDHKGIVETIERLNNEQDKFIFLQLPRVLPEFEKEEKESKDVKDEDISMVDDKQSDLEGEVAKLRVHKSGKITMKIGNVVMDVSRGSTGGLLQQVVLMKNGSYLMGHLEDKIVVTPNFS